MNFKNEMLNKYGSTTATNLWNDNCTSWPVPYTITSTTPWIPQSKTDAAIKILKILMSDGLVKLDTPAELLTLIEKISSVL